jgi:hypothetical protein
MDTCALRLRDIFGTAGVSFNYGVGAFARLSQFPAREPIGYCPNNQEDQNADCDIIGD